MSVLFVFTSTGERAAQVDGPRWAGHRDRWILSLTRLKPAGPRSEVSERSEVTSDQVVWFL